MNPQETCRHLLGHLSDYVDGELEDQALCQEIEHHLEDCENCQVVVDTLKKTIKLYQTSTRKTEMPDEVRARLFQTLHLEEFQESQD